MARQAFETWWIGVPWGFDERWIAEGGYWHAWDRRRSVSVSSTVITDEGGRPVTAAEMVDRFAGVVQGEPIAEAPDGLAARATVVRTEPGSIASRALTGFVAVDGRVLIATITSDDLEWAVRIWRSISYRPAPIEASRPGRRAVLD